MHAPQEPHLTIMKRIMRYLWSTIDVSLHLRRFATTELVVYTDADWAGCADTRRSTSGFVVFLDDSLVSWSSKRQPVVSRSSAEAEYRVVANGVTEASWMCQLLHELHSPLQRATLVYCDNVNAVYLSTNPVCGISARSMWKSTRTSSASVSLPVTFRSSTSPLRCSSPTYSPRGYR